MSIIRDLPFTVQSMPDRTFVSASTMQTSAGTGLASPFTSGESTANTLLSTYGTVCSTVNVLNGAIVDRLGALLGPERYPVVAPATHLYACQGSTWADRKTIVHVHLQHGDSSGGGDMADLSTASQPTDQVYFSTARTSDMKQWDSTGSTGALRVSSAPCLYDLRKAKRFIRGVHGAARNTQTTESTGDENARISGTLTFLGGEYLPATIPEPGSYLASSTTT